MGATGSLVVDVYRVGFWLRSGRMESIWCFACEVEGGGRGGHQE